MDLYKYSVVLAVVAKAAGWGAARRVAECIFGRVRTARAKTFDSGTIQAMADDAWRANLKASHDAWLTRALEAAGIGVRKDW